MELPRSGQSKLLQNDGNAADVVEQMKQMILKCGAVNTSQWSVSTICNSFAHLPPLEFWKYACKVIFKLTYFEPDIGGQFLRTPDRVMRDGRANCASYTIFLASLGKYRNNAITLCLVNFEQGAPYTHIFPMIDGTIYDLTIGQDQQGLEPSKRKKGAAPVIGKTAKFAQIQKFEI